MKSWITQVLFDVRYSYWFIPSVMAIAAILLAAALVAFDIYYFREIPESLLWLFSSKPEGARAILSTVAGSTITVAGVVFSMTIMSVSHATSNYGSRLLLKFLKDRINQYTLGTFTATFIYCLLVLRTVSNGDELSSGVADFVPHVALLGAIGLALVSVIVLIAFIHHVPDTIYIGNVAAERGKELAKRLQDVFVEDKDGCNKLYDFEGSNSVISFLPSNKSGYIQNLEIAGLVKCSAKQSLQVEILKEPGDFVLQGEILMRYIQFPESQEGRPDDLLLSYVGIGSERTPAQDIRFLIEELQQIAIRALSPGVNDPYTAIPCLDWLGAALSGICNKGSRPVRYKDNDDNIRVLLPELNFERLSNIIFDDLRPHVCSDLITALSTANLMKRLVENAEDTQSRKILQHHAQRYLATALQNFDNSEDRNLLRLRFGEAAS